MLLWLLLMLSTTGCGTLNSNQFFCPPTKAYTMTGKVDPNKYQVDRECYKSMTKKQKACYRDAE